MGIVLLEVSNDEVEILLARHEDHTVDFKAIEIAPGKLVNTAVAFANADGGELLVGIAEDVQTKQRTWNGFRDEEAANAHLQVLYSIFPLEGETDIEFLKNSHRTGLLLKITVAKAQSVKRTPDRSVYVRRGAQNLPVRQADILDALEMAKGVVSYEDHTVDCPLDLVLSSNSTRLFLDKNVPTTDPHTWFRKHRLIRNGRPTLAALVLFSEDPQTILPKRCGMKIYRYLTSSEDRQREKLAFEPINVGGCAHSQIYEAEKQLAKILPQVRIGGIGGGETARYPVLAIHELITNAVVHRDYSITDDIRIIIFNDSLEILSPGLLPAPVTPENILQARASRNPSIFNILNKFPDPPNKDIGDGIPTTFRAMREMMLVEPTIEQKNNALIVTLRHKRIPSEQTTLSDMDSEEDAARVNPRSGFRWDRFKWDRLWYRLQAGTKQFFRKIRRARTDEPH